MQVDLQALAAQVRCVDHPSGVVVPHATVSVRPGWIWSTVTVDAPQAQVPTITLKGLPREQARSLGTVLQRARHLAELRRVVDDGHTQILAWAKAVQQQAGQVDREYGSSHSRRMDARELEDLSDGFGTASP